MNNLTVQERKKIIYSEFYKRYKCYPEAIPDQIDRSYKLSKILEVFLPNYIENKADNTNLLEDYFNDFREEILPILSDILIDTLNSDKNIYQLFNCPSLAASNAITRTFNTKLGLFWEKIAILSSNVVSTELEFGFKLVGVDSILYHNNNFYYTQLKTQKNTLTGSQSHRVTQELEKYSHALFVSCLHCNVGWTYSGPIPKLVGEDFWNMTDLNYDDIIRNLQLLLNSVENLLNE